MSGNLAALLYLASGVLFIFALRGLSSPATSRRGNFAGIIGMAIAVVTTLLYRMPSGLSAWIFVIAGIAIGGGIGAWRARTVAMTAMPQLVASFHALVGLAAVFVAAGALYAPQAFGIGTPGDIHTQSLIEMSIGVAIGAITFTGSVIAFLKLDGRMSGAPILLPQRHAINILLAALLVVLVVLFVVTQNPLLFWLIAIVSFVIGLLIIVPIGGADMPVVVSMLNSYSGWAAAGIGFTLGNLALIITGALVGSSGAILSYIMCKAMNRSFISVILGGFGGETAAAGAGHIETRPVKQGSAEDAAFILENAGKVIIVPDSQAIYRVGIRKIFAIEDDLRVVAQADSLENLRAAIERYPTDVVLMEGSLLSGTTNVIPDLLRIAPDVKLIVQTVAADESQTVELYRRGVRGIVSRSISPDLLVRCVRRIAAGETWIDNQSVSWVIEAYRAQAAALVNPRSQPKLSPKEMAIITCITQGKRNKEIAFQLGTTEQVIKNYLRKIYDKLGVSDRLELALYCLHNKIIQNDEDEILVAQKLMGQ